MASEIFTSEPILVGIAEPIRNDPELFEAVNQATKYYEQLIAEQRLYPAKRELSWGSNDEPKQKLTQISASLQESDDYGTRRTPAIISRSRMLDPVSRDMFVLHFIQGVIRARFNQVGEKLDRGIRELELQEANNGLAH